MLSNLAAIRSYKSKRVSSFDRSGGNDDFICIGPGETVTLADLPGSGTIRHIWMTLSSKDENVRRNLVIRMFWDGQKHSSVESPIGDFFGQGWAEKYNFASLPLAATPREGNGLVCYFPMPFSVGAQLTLENESDLPVDSLYFYIDYEEMPVESVEEGRFHAWYNQEITSPESTDGNVENEWTIFGPYPKNPSDKDNYIFCEAEGNGHFVGVNYYVNCPTPIWYGEGDDMFMIDGEPWPGSLHGTGTEDYFNQSWCPEEVYRHPFFGTAKVPDKLGWMGRTHCYRFHVEDPIRFNKSLRASIEHGHANVLTLDLASVAYWYQSLPSKPFPRLPSAKERKPSPVTTPTDIHKWRDAWRKSQLSG